MSAPPSPADGGGGGAGGVDDRDGVLLPGLRDDEEVFVLEDGSVAEHDFASLDDDEQQFPLVWNQLPTPAAFIPTTYLTDVVIILAIVAVAYGLALTTASLFSATPYASLQIDSALRVLPWYAAQSLTRMAAAYAVSLAFSLGYAYVAYRVQFAANMLLILVDILQSIPLLSFLPGVVLGLIALFPGARVGVELAAVLLLFTSMAWNMLLGFHQSLCCIPRDLRDAADVFKLSAWKRFWTLELPSGAIGLVMNSIISVAGGWFFLISIESFELGDRDFRLPGLGSFLAAAAQAGDYRAISAALAVIIFIIVVVDFLVWKPLIAWAARFADTGGGGGGGGGVAGAGGGAGGGRVSASARAGGSSSSSSSAASNSSAQDDGKPRSAVLDVLQRSSLLRGLHARVVEPAWDDFVNLAYRNPFSGERLFDNGVERSLLADDDYDDDDVGGGSGLVAHSRRKDGTPANMAARGDATAAAAHTTARNLLAAARRAAQTAAPSVVRAALLALVGYGVWQAALVVRVLEARAWASLLTGALATFGRVLAALALSLVWTVPAGVAIGRNARLRTVVQPIVQIAASVPATALFPFVLLFLARLGGGLQVGSVMLMMLGTMWYVLFNVIAGAQAIPGELFEVDAIYNKQGWWTRWRKLVLPGIFPYLVTGVVTAVGGAWNASIVSEYVVFQGGVLKTHGLGALISEAAASGDYALLLAGTVVMSVLVLLTNKFVWSKLYRLAETKYRL